MAAICEKCAKIAEIVENGEELFEFARAFYEAEDGVLVLSLKAVSDFC